VDVQERLDELTVLIEDAKAMPLSASCLVNRSQVLDLIEEIRHLLPESVQRADELLADREAVVQDGRREADRILERARAEADRLVSEHEVYLAAVDEADALGRLTAQETARMRKETDDYIDSKLATFEITLQKTLQTVDRGRERLRSQMYQELAPPAEPVYDDDAYANGGFDQPPSERGDRR
jgi:cell division septum initiation protein DivIVA